MKRMLSDAEKSKAWNIVLVYAIDRFGRNSIEIAVNKQKLKKNGKTLISATQRTSENIDGTKNLDGTPTATIPTIPTMTVGIFLCLKTIPYPLQAVLLLRQ